MTYRIPKQWQHVALYSEMFALQALASDRDDYELFRLCHEISLRYAYVLIQAVGHGFLVKFTEGEHIASQIWGRKAGAL